MHVTSLLRRGFATLALALAVTAGAGTAFAASAYKIYAPLRGMSRPDLPCCLPIYVAGPPVISGKWIAFTSRNGPGDGIWSYDIERKKLKKLAGTETPVPGGSGNFSAFGIGDTAAISIGGDTIAFFGWDAANSPGIYTVAAKGGAVARIADRATRVPKGGGETFWWLGDVTANATTVSFWGYATGPDGLSGVYQANLDGSGLKKVIDTTDHLDARVPGGTLPGYFYQYGNPKLGKASVVFQASGLFDPVSGANAVFRAKGGFTDIADNVTLLEGGTPGAHVRISDLSAAQTNSAVAFRADQPATGYAGLFKVRNADESSAFVSTEDLFPGTATPFAAFLGFGYDATGLAFTGYRVVEGSTLEQSVFFTAAPGEPLVLVAAGADYYLPSVGDRSVSEGNIVFYEGTNYNDTFFLAVPKN